MKILLAPDKFKGTLDAASVARAMALGVRDVSPDAETRMQPLADGGEGSLDCMAASSVAIVAAEDAYGEAVSARVLDDGTVAAIAAHETQRLPPRPTRAASLRASSRGTGLALLAGRRMHPERELLVWIGGTASTDGGAGAAQAAGWLLLDARGRALAPGGGALRALARIEPPAEPFGARVTGACDVSNPLLGVTGAAPVFGPQKGAGPDEKRVLEDGLTRLCERIEADLGLDVGSIPFGGAGGGLAAGLVAFFEARLEEGFARVARAARLRERVRWADVVVTGEGRVDEGSLGGKVASKVAALCRDEGTPCLVVAGEVALPAPLPATKALGALAVASLTDHCGRRRAFDDAAGCIRDVTAALVSGLPGILSP